MSNTFTVSLPPSIRKEIDALAKRTGKSRTQVVREAVRRQIAFWSGSERCASKLVPEAQARGIYTDEQVFKLVS